jgi:integrase
MAGKSQEPEWRLTKLDGEYCVTWYELKPDGKRARRRYRLGTENYREANAVAPARYAELTRPEGTTVSVLWEGYRKAKAGRVVLETMEYTWKALEPFFGALEAETISTDHCEAYTKLRRSTTYKAKGWKKEKTVSDGSIHTELGHLRMILVWAAGKKLITHAPQIERPSKPPPKDRHLTRVEVEKMIETAKSPHIKLAIRLMVGTAARVTAILELTWDRVNFDRNTIQLFNPFDQKARKTRATVPMNAKLREALLEQKNIAMTDHVIEYGSEPVKSIKKGIRITAKAIGLDDVSPHVFRHTAAVWMAEDGHAMSKIAQYLGHADDRITSKVYARYSPGHQQDLADSLEI